MMDSKLNINSMTKQLSLFKRQKRKATQQSCLAASGCFSILLILGSFFFLGIKIVLDDMTLNDCKIHKIHAACESLNIDANPQNNPDLLQ